MFIPVPPRFHISQTHFWQVAAGLQSTGRLHPLPTPRLKTKIMADIRREIQPQTGFKLGDILFALFKRKRTIIVCATIGIIAAAAVYFLYPPSYESQAKLLVRYVLERSGIDPVEAEKASSGANTEADRVIGAEIEILTSWDLAMEVARAIGPQRLLPPPQDLLSRVARAIGLKGLLPPSGASATEGAAASSIASGLKV